jgi:hypothetical protein
MAFNVNEFIAAGLKFGGARSSLFQVNITNPINGISDFQFPLLCRATNIPASTVNTIEVPYFGRRVKLAGNRVYAEWPTTIMNDEDYLIRNALEQWNNSINIPQSNLRDLASSSPANYKSTAQVTHFSKTGIPIRVYELVNIWPSNIDAMDLSWDGGDTIQEFNCTWQYDYWTVVGGVTGNGGTQ